MSKKTQEYLLFPKHGALTRDDDLDFAQAVTGVSKVKGGISVALPRLSPVTYPSDQITVDQSTGRLSFISSDTPYRVRELRDDDGEWMSKYKTLLPLEALEALNNAPIRGETVAGTGTNGLTAPDESLDAFSMDDSAYIVGVVYTNDSGRWSRVDGDWILLASDDDTFSDLVVTPIDPAKADAFLTRYDRTFITVSDAEQYEAEASADDSLNS